MLGLLASNFCRFRSLAPFLFLLFLIRYRRPLGTVKRSQESGLLSFCCWGKVFPLSTTGRPFPSRTSVLDKGLTSIGSEASCCPKRDSPLQGHLLSLERSCLDRQLLLFSIHFNPRTTEQNQRLGYLGAYCKTCYSEKQKQDNGPPCSPYGILLGCP